MNTQFKNFKIVKFDSQQGKSFFNLINSNRARLSEYFAGTVANTKTLEDTLNYCKLIDQRMENKSYFPFIIINRENNAFIGLIDVKNIEWGVPKAEMGYFIDVNYEGKGIISQALDFVIEYLTKEYQFKKLLCRVNSRNLGSVNVALKNGFELEGTIRNDYRTTNNKVVDLNYYGKIFDYI